MTVIQEYYYDHQLKRYLIQFMALFAGMQVMVGQTGELTPRLIKVPIVNASKDRVVAWIKGEQTQTKLLRVPMFSATFVGLRLAPELKKGVGQTRRKAFMPTGGLFPNDMSVVEQRMPVPYVANFELGIFASNQDQHYQIVEQILSIFDPQLQIQTSDDVFDWTKITQVELTNINFEENVPSGVDRRLIQSSLTFEIPVYISVPSDVHKRLVEQIYMRIGAVSASANTSEEIIAELDAENVAYQKIFDAANIDIEK